MTPSGAALPEDYFRTGVFAHPQPGEFLARLTCVECGATQHAWDRPGRGATHHEVEAHEGFRQHRRRHHFRGLVAVLRARRRSLGKAA